MTSRPRPARIRKQPGERRAEIVRTAARIALEEALERVTLRRVADELGVRPGLVGHYFPAAGDLVSEAFTHAATGERAALLPEGERALPPSSGWPASSCGSPTASTATSAGCGSTPAT
ncbi:TetR family transcriptional regulator [Streptomyces sp. NPDC056160]|uniref:TetR family transcriptional regulator n=1 Tax=Streptomyces sp. NPDC056160 TaxID=3345731 RepID=UPI0035DB785E